MASKWEVMATVFENLNDTDDYGVITAMKEILHLCHLFDDDKFDATDLGEAIFEYISDQYATVSWEDMPGTGFAGPNERFKAAEEAAAAMLEPGEVMTDGTYNPNDTAQPIPLPSLTGEIR